MHIYFFHNSTLPIHFSHLVNEPRAFFSHAIALSPGDHDYQEHVTFMGMILGKCLMEGKFTLPFSEVYATVGALTLCQCSYTQPRHATECAFCPLLLGQAAGS